MKELLAFFFIPKIYFRVYDIPSVSQILRQMNPIHILTLYLFMIHFYIMLASMDLQVVFSGFLTQKYFLSSLIFLPFHKGFQFIWLKI